MLLFSGKKTVAVTVLLLLCYCGEAQTKLNCKEIHEGVFYNYPKNSADQFVDTREGDYVHENNLATGDTSLWKIKWNDDCTYTLTLVDLNGKSEQQSRDAMKKHKLVFTIDKLTDDYYTYAVFLDRTSNLPFATDTMWRHEKVNIVNNELFKQIPSGQVFKKPVVSDTAKYALLYIYRPGKTALSFTNYLVYFDNNIMCEAQNSSGFVFKIMKEGTFELKSRIYKDECSLPLHIHFGNTYFVKTFMKWGMYKGMSNSKLQNQLIDPVDGWADFQNIRHF